MNYKRSFLYLLTIFGLGTSLFSDTIERDIEDQDIQALRDWINTKRQVSLKEIGGDLSISGEVRTEFQTSRETKKGRTLRGSGSNAQYPGESFDVEVNLMFDYRTERTWAAIKLEFDNDAGIFNGTLNKLSLERAYWGVRFIDQDLLTLDAEAGRRKMSSSFDSKIEFNSFYDGILVRYDQSFESIADFYIHAGPFVINERRNQYGYMGEIGLLDIGDTGLYTKYSLIDWDTKHYKNKAVNNRFRFLISQWLWGYRYQIKSINKIMVAYLAGLYNHKAKKLAVSDFKRANYGGYIGFSLGQLRKQYDFAFDINYQVVAAQSIPDFDVSGIGMGNADKSGFYTTLISPIDGGVPTTRETAGGQTNYRGFNVTLDILLTDKLDLQQNYMQSITLDSRIGPFRRFHQYEIEFIYTW